MIKISQNTRSWKNPKHSINETNTQNTVIKNSKQATTDGNIN